MGRLRKGLWVFNDASGEYDSPGIEGRTIRHREVLVDWLNRALAGLPADRDAAERVGALIRNMNASTAEYLKAVDSWNAKGKPEAVPLCKTFREIASVHDYELELDLCPRHGSKKWHIAFHCVTAPSGDAYERWQLLNEKGQDPQPLHEKWPEVPKRFNPECQAVNAVVIIAVDGRLGTMKRCEVRGCGKWFLTKDDPRVLCCADHDVDDLRKGTPKRKQQVNAAANRARKRAKSKKRNTSSGSTETNHISRLVVVLRGSHGSGGIRLAEINRSALLSDAIGFAQAAEAYRISRTRATGALKQDLAVPKTLLPPATAGIENSLFTAAGIVH